MIVYLALAACVLIALWAVLTFNSLVRARNRVDEAWSGVDVQLRRRHDLVPILAGVVRAYADHEEEALLAMAAARSAAGAADAGPYRQRFESDLSSAMSVVGALAERYPRLQASENFLRLQADLAEVEDEIRAARAIYNSNVEIYLTRIQTIPDSLFAHLGTFPPRRFFDLSSPERMPVRTASVVA